MLTLARFDRIAWRFGTTRRELHTMSLAEWHNRRLAYNDNERAEWQRSMAIVNTIRGLVGADPIEMDTSNASARKRPDREGYEALKGRHMDWIQRHTN